MAGKLREEIAETVLTADDWPSKLLNEHQSSFNLH
jgi:hypothetical protein